jgi:signal peptidase I
MSLKFEKNYHHRIAMRALYPSFVQEVWDYFVYFMSVFILISFVYAMMRFMVFNSIKISGSSMAPYHQTGDTIYIDLLAKYTGNFKRGDVIVLNSPKTCSNTDDLYIKRIVGLPGEQVIFENGNVYIRNPKLGSELIKLDESAYIDSKVKTYKNITPPYPDKLDFEGRFEEPVLNANEYYFLGDNRTGSIDGRKCGALNKSEILGREFYRFDTDKKSSFTSSPSYNLPSQF